MIKNDGFSEIRNYFLNLLNCLHQKYAMLFLNLF